MTRRNWTREEHVLAFNLYCKTPFGKMHSTYKPIMELASILGRTNSSVSMKLGNFARLDPTLKARNIKGLSQGAKGEEEVWNEFNNNWEELAFESERILAGLKKQNLEEAFEIPTHRLPTEGKEREAIVKTRVNQNFFRKIILTSYQQKCCITGLSAKELLIASHIIPWSMNDATRINPANGLCLNALHDKAFDRGLLTVLPDFTIKISDKLLSQIDEKTDTSFIPYIGKSIVLPEKFTPKPEFLEWHNHNVFEAV